MIWYVPLCVPETIATDSPDAAAPIDVTVIDGLAPESLNVCVSTAAAGPTTRNT